MGRTGRNGPCATCGMWQRRVNVLKRGKKERRMKCLWNHLVSFCVFIYIANWEPAKIHNAQQSPFRGASALCNINFILSKPVTPSHLFFLYLSSKSHWMDAPFSSARSSIFFFFFFNFFASFAFNSLQNRRHVPHPIDAADMVQRFDIYIYVMYKYKKREDKIEATRRPKDAGGNIERSI